MDTRLPMMVQSPDFAGSMMNGLLAGGTARQSRQQNAIADLYQNQGPQIMAGDPNALAALSRFDPTAAQGIQQNNLGMASTRMGMEHTQLQMQTIRDQAKAKAAEAVAAADAKRVAAEIDQTKRTMAGAAPLLMTWKQSNDPAAAQALIAYLGRNGISATPESLEATIYAMQGGLEGMTAGMEALKLQSELMAPPKPADDYQRYVQEETAAGRKPLPRLEFMGAGRTPPAVPSDIQEYNFAVKQGFTGTFQEYQTEQKRAGAAQISMGDAGQSTGKIPDGYARIADPTNPSGFKLVVIPGGPVATEAAAAQAEAAAKAGVQQNNSAISGDTIINAARKARELVGDFAVGVGSQQIADTISSSDAAELRRQVAVLKANATVETLTAMRAASPTGGALGAVSDSENAMLSAKLGALDPSASSAAFKAQIDDYEHTLLQIIHGRSAGDQIFLSTRPAASSQTAPTLTPEELQYLGGP